MSRIAYILFLVMSIFCSGCLTESHQVHAMLQKYDMVKSGMTRSEVFAIVPAPDIAIGTGDGKQVVSWHYGSAFANEDYVLLTVLFGKDGRVEHVDIETGHGRAPRFRHGLMSNG